MINVPVRIVGDQWINKQEVLATISTDITKEYVLDLGAEGPSLHCLGVVDSILSLGISPANISIANWSNSVEQVPFVRNTLHLASHFFWHHNLHTVQRGFVQNCDKLFGLFIGRKTISRCKIFYDMFRDYNQSVYLSAMKTRVELPWHVSPDIVTCEQLNDWVNIHDQQEFCNWWEHCPITSIDNRAVWDQYVSNANTNHSILDYYDNFLIELVCESYCYGTTFFPTEKTVRPIAACKPFVVFGPCNFLKRLKDYGFKTFSNYWPEDYDAYEGIARWNKMQETISYIYNESRNNTKFAAALKSTVDFNKQNLVSVVKQFEPQ